VTVLFQVTAASAPLTDRLRDVDNLHVRGAAEHQRFRDQVEAAAAQFR
jgi:hypothetical protein